MALSELLLYAVFAGFILLFNLLTQWLSRRRGEQGEDAIPPPQAGEDIAPPQQQARKDIALPPRPVQRVEEVWGRDAQPASAPAPAAGPAPAPTPAPAPRAPGDLPPAGPARRPLPELGQPLARPRSTRAQLKLGSRADLRQAIVTMTILNPCRALAPFDEGEGPARR